MSETATTALAVDYSAHPFAHLGPGPYRFVGSFYMPGAATFGANAEGYNTMVREIRSMVKEGAGSCAHCGMAISNIFIIRCADGDQFGVGCDCIMKLDNEPKLKSQVEKARADMERKKRQAKEKDALASGLAWFEESREALRQVPHPQTWRAERGETFEDAVDWFLKNAGKAGKLKILKQAKQALA